MSSDIQKQQAENKRDICLDMIRAIAIVSVVFIHCYEQFYYIDNSEAYLFGRMGVPLFLMLSAATMIGREYKSIGSFYARKVLSLYGVSVFWLFLYGIGQTDPLNNLVNALGLVSSAKHLWYFSILIVLYLALPFLSYLNSQSIRDVMILGIITLCISMFQLFGFIWLGNQYMYVFVYLIWGYLCYRRKLHEKVPFLVWLALLAVALFAFHFLINNPWCKQQFTDHNADIWWYSSPLVLIPSLFLFPALLHFKVKGHIFTILSRCSFGIFVVHLYIIDLIDDFVLRLPLENGTVITLILWAAAFTLSFAASFLLGKIPFLRKLVLQ